jgi:drug/metabolite transporter (DMT)-like permease
MALVAAVCQGIGMVASNLAFQQANVSPTWSAMVRIVGSTLFLLPVVWLMPTARGMAPRWTPRLVRLVISAAMVGTLGGLSLQQAAVKYTFAGVAQTLIAASTLFVLAIAVVLGLRPSPRVWAGTALAVAGIACLFWFDPAATAPSIQPTSLP